MSNWLHFEFCTNCKRLTDRSNWFAWHWVAGLCNTKGMGTYFGYHKTAPPFFVVVLHREPIWGIFPKCQVTVHYIPVIKTIQKLLQQCVSCTVLYGNHTDKDAPYKTLPCTCVTTDIVYSNAPQRMQFSWGNSTVGGRHLCVTLKRNHSSSGCRLTHTNMKCIDGWFKDFKSPSFLLQPQLHVH